MTGQRRGTNEVLGQSRVAGESASAVALSGPFLRKLHPPHEDAYDLRLTGAQIEALRILIDWYDPSRRGNTYPATVLGPVGLQALADVKAAL